LAAELSRLDLARAHDEPALSGRVRGKERKNAPASASRTVKRDDSKLLAAVATGDRLAFEELYLLHHRRLFGFLYKMTGRQQMSEELVNDVMLVVWQKASTFAGRSLVSTWIMGVAYNKALKAIRKMGRAPTLVEVEPQMAVDSAGPEADLSSRDRRARISQALRRLSPEHRAAVELTYYHGFSYREIAQIVGCPENTVKTRMFHARRRLRSLLARPSEGSDVQEGEV
jgi:RNA polymerase sigma-70 factor (ECF subfamily)